MHNTGRMKRLLLFWAALLPIVLANLVPEGVAGAETAPGSLFIGNLEVEKETGAGNGDELNTLENGGFAARTTGKNTKYVAGAVWLVIVLSPPPRRRWKG